MNDFDYVNAVTKAYKFVWAQCMIIFAMAMVPLAVKVVNYMIIETLGMSENHMRQGLLLLPAFFVEGWLIARLIRFAVQGERIEQHLSGDPALDLRRFEGHMRAVTASMIVFVLIKLAMSLFIGLFMSEQAKLVSEMPADAPEYTVSSIVMGFGIIGILLYAFRLLWLYVPLALEIDLREFLVRIRAFTSSMYMFAIYVLCFVPLALLMMMLLNAAANMMNITSGEETQMYRYVAIAIQTIIDTVLTICASIAMAFGVQALYTGGDSDTQKGGEK